MGEDITISIEVKEISNNPNEKILGVYFDNKLNFKNFNYTEVQKVFSRVTKTSKKAKPFSWVKFMFL